VFVYSTMKCFSVSQYKTLILYKNMFSKIFDNFLIYRLHSHWCCVFFVCFFMVVSEVFEIMILQTLELV